ncbi:DNA-directed RNA polymerase III subunit RPC6-like, partial [Tropilaelaps mercedesae]
AGVQFSSLNTVGRLNLLMGLPEGAVAHKGKTAAEKYQDDMVNMRNNSVASTKEVWSFIKQLGISKVELDVEDINVILGTLCFQGKVVRSVSSEKIKDSNEYLCLWAALDYLYQSPMAICNIACGRCPVRHDCSLHGVRNPSKCEYTIDFLKDIEDLDSSPSEEVDPSGPICDALLDY